jgi:hypothetical protein
MHSVNAISSFLERDRSCKARLERAQVRFVKKMELKLDEEKEERDKRNF